MQRAIRQLENVLKWKLQFEPRYKTVQAIKYDEDTVTVSPVEQPLPFPSDSVETDGARGVETPRGVDTWLELWAATFAWLLDVSGPRMTGAWLLSLLRDHPDLNPLPTPTTYEDNPHMATWVEGLLHEWDKFTKELNLLHTQLADQTGHKPLRRGLCPKCKQGTLISPAGPHGYEDEATCTNKECNTIIDYSQEEVAASFRAAMRDPEVNATYHLTVDEIKIIWPRLNTSTLRKWVERGKVRKQNGRYNLADVNAIKTDTHP